MAWFKTVTIETTDGDVSVVTRDQQFDNGEYFSDLTFCRDGIAREGGKETALPLEISVEDFVNEADLKYRFTPAGWQLEDTLPWDNLKAPVSTHCITK